MLNIFNRQLSFSYDCQDSIPSEAGPELGTAQPQLVSFFLSNLKEIINKWFEYQQLQVLVKLSGEGAGKSQEILNRQCLYLMQLRTFLKSDLSGSFEKNLYFHHKCSGI